MLHPGSKYRLLAIRLMNANMQFAVFRFLDLHVQFIRRCFRAVVLNPHLLSSLYPPSSKV